MQWQLAARTEAQQALEEGALALAAGLAAMPAVSLGEVAGGLGELRGGVQGLGDARVDELVAQVGAGGATNKFLIFCDTALR